MRKENFMPFTLKTLADCQQSLADRHDNGTVPANTTILARYTRLINRGIDYCADRMRLEKETTVTVTSGVGDLPDDFILVNAVFDSSDNEYFKIGADDVISRVGRVYWVTGNQVDGFVLNTPTDDTFTVQYAFRPAPLVNTTDVCVIPDIEAPVAYAYAMLRKGESDPFEDAETTLQECDARIKEMNSAYAINTDSLGFQIY